MMKQAAVALLAGIVLLSCKKENDQKVSATGYWDGNIYITHATVLNRPDGTCRIYHDIQLEDTAGVDAKYEGTYEVQGNSYRAEFYANGELVEFVEAELLPGDVLKGRLMYQFFAYEVNLVKRKQ
jgi:hypothetical protein